ncbi:hypothetical protein KC19_2G125700 [Ceratodon purpureus]|uniref:UBA domain-containing protein n=1 Tax=Ceratodon purpureus TaxID=3225 RepID=A0A8T0IVB7_CERPU|nr:hypothetical protein KC19_2G125700 [Ceratodon purpureus]
MTMAPAACQSLHELEGYCEYCGEVCDSTQDELNAIACTFEGCPSPTIYHQHCIETYLKTIRLDKQRKTGFQCPRGCGKGSKSDKPCPGRVTKSHPIHARNDSSKKRRKAKMPEIVLPTVAPTIPGKKEKEDKPQQLSTSKSSKVENKDTVPKPLVLNRASTFPSLPGNKGISNQSGSASASSSNTSNAVVKVLSRESTVAAIAAARSEIAASKRGSSAKNNTETYMSATSFDSRSAQNSESDDDSSRQLMISKDLRKVLPVGRGVETAPVVNAWARGRCNELLNGFKQTDLKTPAPHLVSLNPSQDINIPTSSTSIPRPPVVRQPASAGVAVGEEDDLEARRLRARTKNEKKHLQRAAKAREKREAEEAAAALAATSAATPVMQNERQSKQTDSDTIIKQWSENFISAIRHRKFLALAKLLQEYGFTDWQSNLAVRICGSDVEQCLDWLLRNESSMQTDMHVHREEKIDVISEMDVLKEVMRSEGFSQEQVEVAVISTDGDIDAALKVLRSSSSYWNSSRESSQGTFHNMVSPHQSFGQASSQSSSDLATGVWDGMLNGTADGQDFSPLSGSANGSDSQKSFGPFASGFISDLARYNSLVGLEDSHHTSGNSRAVGGLYSLENQGQPQSVHTTSMSQRNAAYYETPSGGLQSQVQNSYELTASTVTSVAAAVLNDTFGFDEQLISRMTDIIAVNEATFDSTVNAVPSLNGIWSYPSSTFTSFATNKGITDSGPYMSLNGTLDGQSFFNSPFGTYGEGFTPAFSDSARRAPAKNGFHHASPFGASLWNQQPVKLIDEAAEEQDLLMSELLSHLLV